jgi:large subunit ribosomal protein L23
MAIFSKKTEVKKADKTVTWADKVIIGPRVAEKSALLSDKSVYCFEVVKKATKTQIAKAMKLKYKVDALKVNITNLPATRVFVRGKWGSKPGVKKAVVFLKKGEKIEFM